MDVNQPHVVCDHKSETEKKGRCSLAAQVSVAHVQVLGCWLEDELNCRPQVCQGRFASVWVSLMRAGLRQTDQARVVVAS